MLKKGAAPRKKGPSRLVIYTVVGAIAVYAVVLLTETEPVAHKRIVRVTTTATQSADPNGMTPQDFTARFARYTKQPTRDPFAPAVVIAKPSAQAADPLAPAGGRGGWQLTGINSVNGVDSALVENSATGESAFLRSGDLWNGLKVVAVGGEAITFRNALGQETRLGFPLVAEPDTPKSTVAPAPIANVPSAPPLPALGEDAGPRAGRRSSNLSVRPMPVTSASAMDVNGSDQ